MLRAITGGGQPAFVGPKFGDALNIGQFSSDRRDKGEGQDRH